MDGQSKWLTCDDIGDFPNIMLTDDDVFDMLIRGDEEEYDLDEDDDESQEEDTMGENESDGLDMDWDEFTDYINDHLIGEFDGIQLGENRFRKSYKLQTRKVRMPLPLS